MVRAAGQEGPAVGAERHANDRGLKQCRLGAELPGFGIPESRNPITAPGKNGLAVGAERHGQYLVSML